MTKEQAKKFANCLKNNYTIDFNDMADFCDTVIKALEQDVPDTNVGKIDSDCVSRQAVVEWLEHATDDSIEHAIDSNLEFLPPVTPTQCIAVVRFSKEDLRKICNERIEIECTHGTCKDCKYWCQYDGLDTCRLILRTRHRDFYCADFEKRGSENDSN